MAYSKANFKSNGSKQHNDLSLMFEHCKVYFSYYLYNSQHLGPIYDR